MEQQNIYKNQNSESFDEVVIIKKKSKRKGKLLAFLLIAVIAVLGVYVCNSKMLVVKNVEVVSLDKNVEVSLPYTQEELISGLGLESGQSLYKTSESRMAENAKYNLTYIKEVEIFRKWPSTIVARVTAEKPRFYMSIDGKMYVLSDELRVLDATENIEDIEINKLILLKTPTVKKCVKGEMADIGNDIKKIVIDVANTLEKENALHEITLLDISDKFNIKLMHDTRFEVKIGDAKDLGNKIKMMNKIVEDKNDELASGVIDVTKDYGKTGSLSKFS